MITIQVVYNNLPQHPTKRYKKRDMSKINTIVVHHSATMQKMPKGRQSWMGTIEQFANYHIDSHNWPGIGYHYVIDPDGVVWKTNPIGVTSWHTGRYNTPSIGVMLIGNFQKEKPTGGQIHALRELVEILKDALPNITKVIGHKQAPGHKSNACPGSNLMPIVAELS